MAEPVIDWYECVGCGACADICPEAFELRTDDKAYIIDAKGCGRCDCNEAAEACPVKCITFR